MLIEPHIVEAGFVKRWSIQALALIFRSPIIWTFIVLSYFFLNFVNIAIYNLLCGTFLFILSLEFAAFTDFNKMNIDGFISCIKTSFKSLISSIKERSIFLAIFAVVTLSIESVTKQENSLFFPMMSSIFLSIIFFSNLSLNNKGKYLLILSHPFKRAFECNDIKVVKVMCEKAANKNPLVLIFFDVFLLLVMVLSVVFLPFIAIFFAPFLPCLTYIAFREIFWGTKENQKQQEQITETNTKLIPIKIKD